MAPGGALPRALAASAEPLLNQLSDRLLLRESLSGQFRQYKHLPFLEQPFESSGHFALDDAGGLRWQVEQPMPSLMLVRDDSVTLDGKPVKDRGTGQLITLIMRGFMVGELDGLLRYFSVSGDLDRTPWVLELKPTGRLSAVIRGVTLQGDTYLQRIEILEPESAQTVIEFCDVHPGATPQDAVED